MYSLSIINTTNPNEILLTNNSTAGETVYFTIYKLSPDGTSLILCDSSDFSYSNSASNIIVFPLDVFPTVSQVGQTILASANYTIQFSNDNLYVIYNSSLGTSDSPFLAYIKADANMQECNRRIVVDLWCDNIKCNDQQMILKREKRMKFFTKNQAIAGIWSKMYQIQTLTNTETISASDQVSLAELIDSLLSLCDCNASDIRRSGGFNNYWRNNSHSPCGCK